MVITRVGSGGGGRSADQEALEWLEKLAADSEMTDDEVEEALADYDRQDEEKIDWNSTFELRREKFKREKSKANFESGNGTFRRG
jgi:hypothetical protein